MSQTTRTYFLQAEIGGPIKIGQTGRHVSKRLAENQTGNGWRLNLLGHTDAITEAALHAALKRDRRQGEWFNNTDHVRQAIADVCPSAAAKIIINPALDFPAVVRKPPSPQRDWIRKICATVGGFYAAKDQIIDAFEALVPAEGRCENPRAPDCDCESCCFQDVRFSLDLRMIEGYVVVEDAWLLAKLDAAFLNTEEVACLDDAYVVMEWSYRNLDLICDPPFFSDIAVGHLAGFDLVKPSSVLRRMRGQYCPPNR